MSAKNKGFSRDQGILENFSEVRLADPWLSQELEKYAYPLPSRLYILEVLSSKGKRVDKAYSFKQLARLFDLANHELNGFRVRLMAMVRDGQLGIYRNGKWSVLNDKNLVLEGEIKVQKRGVSFLPNGSLDPIGLIPAQLRDALDGDEVQVKLLVTKKTEPLEVQVIKILSRAVREKVGKAYLKKERWFIRSDEGHSVLHLPLTDDSIQPSSEGEMVSFDVVYGTSRYPSAKIKVSLGLSNQPEVEVEVAIRKNHLPHEFSQSTLQEAEKISTSVSVADSDRTDLTHLPFVTIDGETAQDFDDALFCKPIEKTGKSGACHYDLYVAIADVSAYVLTGSALEKDALERGNSTYFPNRVIPMLPEVLSNGICSLKPDALRYAMVCQMIVTATGEIEKYSFYPAVIKSHARLTYTDVAKALYENDIEAQKKLKSRLLNLKNLDAIFQLFLKARKQRGAIDFDLPETKILFNEKGTIETIVTSSRTDAHRLVEECMLAANVCAANFLETHDHPCPYRIHKKPSFEKLDKLQNFLKSRGLLLGGGKRPSSQDYDTLVASLSERPDREVIQTALLRSLQQAEYFLENEGHFGLAYESYTHFTSPIRRFTDLMVHRAIRASLQGEKLACENWDAHVKHCSVTERRSDEATRDFEAWLKCFYMKDRLGETFSAVVNGVTSFGVFVLLDNFHVEGLVHIKDIGTKDYFHFDQHRQCLYGEKSHQTIGLGDPLIVQLVRVDLESKQIDLVPVTLNKRGSRKSKQKKTS